jgi:hypothetical protein
MTADVLRWWVSNFTGTSGWLDGFGVGRWLSLVAVTARDNGMVANFRRDPAMVKVHRVVVLAPHGVYPFDLGIAHRVFGAADGRYEVVTCTIDGRPVRTKADFSITVEHGPVLRTADTVCGLAGHQRRRQNLGAGSTVADREKRWQCEGVGHVEAGRNRR